MSDQYEWHEALTKLAYDVLEMEVSDLKAALSNMLLDLRYVQKWED